MKTVRVRIAVAVDDKGKWSSFGWESQESGRSTDEEAVGYAQENLDSGRPQHVVFVEADVPLPESTTIEGEVKP